DGKQLPKSRKGFFAWLSRSSVTSRNVLLGAIGLDDRAHDPVCAFNHFLGPAYSRLELDRARRVLRCIWRAFFHRVNPGAAEPPWTSLDGKWRSERDSNPRY